MAPGGSASGLGATRFGVAGRDVAGGPGSGRVSGSLPTSRTGGIWASAVAASRARAINIVVSRRMGRVSTSRAGGTPIAYLPRRAAASGLLPTDDHVGPRGAETGESGVRHAFPA